MTSAAVEKCGKDFCQGFFIPRGERWTRKILEQINKKQSKTFKYTKKQKKQLESSCKLAYCNPDCIGTIFQKGKKMPILEDSKQFKGKDKKFMNDLAKDMRKHIFKSKTNVLKNGFYEKLPIRTRKLIQKKGALSGCASVVIGV